MIIIYFIIFIILFYEIYKYISQNINYSQFEHFYNNSDGIHKALPSKRLRDVLHLCPDLVYKTITTGLNASQNNIENFNPFDTSYNLYNPNNLVTNDIIYPNYLYNPINYWYSPLDYWLNPYVYYNWYGSRGGSSSYSTSYSSPVINIHRRHIRSGSRSSNSGTRRHR